MMVTHKLTKSGGIRTCSRGFIRSHLVSLLAGIGVASIALFSTNTALTVMGFIREMRKDGYATTASATVTSSEIKIDTRMVPLPSAFWQDREFSVPAPELFEEKTPAVPVYVAIAARPGSASMDPERAERPTQPISSPKPEPTPTPKPAFDPELLQRAIHKNLSSVFTGDLPYILLKSGDRLYPGSRLTEGVTLEAISPTGILCTTPLGILKISPETGSSNEVNSQETPGSGDLLPLDASEVPASDTPPIKSNGEKSVLDSIL